MKKRGPTGCPVLFSLDIYGDKWSLVILFDLLIEGKCHFREFLMSEGKIASNILSSRLETLIQTGIIVKHSDPTNKSAAIYVPTKKALDLLPMLIEMIRWGIVYNQDIDMSDQTLQQIQADPEGVRRRIVEKFALESQSSVPATSQ